MSSVFLWSFTENKFQYTSVWFPDVIIDIHEPAYKVGGQVFPQTPHHANYKILYFAPGSVMVGGVESVNIPALVGASP